ncbi:GerAB/ArcD/ProY family transporter [Neobacillus vireti]|uniref:GerAB/ArcD/ProY family transporter n=1 Tax=Neobacillus vireti TaxID=220686 RepID=UPI0030000C6F
MVKIASIELFALMVNFLLGSAIVVGWNFNTKQDIWITNFLSLAIGIGLFYLYMLLHSFGKWSNLIEILELGFGKWLSRIVGIMYGLYFLYIAGRVLKDFSFFIGSVLFNNVSFWIISFTFLFVVSYCCYLGIEAIARSSLLLFAFTGVIIFVLIILGFISPYFEISRLTPVFRTSWKQVMSAVFPTGLTFPYGELIVFTMLFPYVDDRKGLRRYGCISICITGVLLFLAGEMILGLLGSETVTSYIFPFVKALELTSLLETLPHLEVLAVIINLIGGFIKISVFMYSGLMIFENSFPKIKRNRLLVTSSAITLLSTFILSKNIIQHLFIGLKIVPLYMHIPFQLLIPAILVFMLAIKKYIA